MRTCICINKADRAPFARIADRLEMTPSALLRLIIRDYLRASFLPEILRAVVHEFVNKDKTFKISITQPEFLYGALK